MTESASGKPEDGGQLLELPDPNTLTTPEACHRLLCDALGVAQSALEGALGSEGSSQDLTAAINDGSIPPIAFIGKVRADGYRFLVLSPPVDPKTFWYGLERGDVAPDTLSELGVAPTERFVLPEAAEAGIKSYDDVAFTVHPWMGITDKLAYQKDPSAFDLPKVAGTAHAVATAVSKWQEERQQFPADNMPEAAMPESGEGAAEVPDTYEPLLIDPVLAERLFREALSAVDAAATQFDETGDWDKALRDGTLPPVTCEFVTERDSSIPDGFSEKLHVLEPSTNPFLLGEPLGDELSVKWAEDVRIQTGDTADTIRVFKLPEVGAVYPYALPRQAGEEIFPINTFEPQERARMIWSVARAVDRWRKKNAA